MEFQLEQAKEILGRTPATLNVLLNQLSDEWLISNEGVDTWTPIDVVGHLIHGERTDWIPRARIILEQGANRRFEAFDRLAQFHDSEGKSLGELLDEFERLRAESLATLASWRLTEEELALE